MIPLQASDRHLLGGFVVGTARVVGWSVMHAERFTGSFGFLRRVAFAAAIGILLWTGTTAASAEEREWTRRNGHPFRAELLAADGLRATFGSGGVPKWIVPLSELDAKSAASVQAWRSDDRTRPLVDARLLAPWPAHAEAPAFEARLVGEEAGQQIYESPNFRVLSDLKLPLPAVRDLVMVFESTRNALIALPLGLHAGGETDKYTVLFAGTVEAYAALGGPPGTGGYFHGRSGRMLVSLANLGITQKAGAVQLQYDQNLFVLKHEVTHQLLARWHGRLPAWLNEGLPEFIASLPYSRGRYTLQNPTAGTRDYVLKWRKAREDRSVSIVPPAKLLTMQDSEWNAATAAGSPYDLYNSAGLLTTAFVAQRNGAPIAGVLDSLRRGAPNSEAIEKHLLQGKAPEDLTSMLIQFGKRLGIEVKVP